MTGSITRAIATEARESPGIYGLNQRKNLDDLDTTRRDHDE
jgi:hypothetical protein